MLPDLAISNAMLARSNCGACEMDTAWSLNREEAHWFSDVYVSGSVVSTGSVTANVNVIVWVHWVHYYYMILQMLAARQLSHIARDASSKCLVEFNVIINCTLLFEQTLHEARRA